MEKGMVDCLLALNTLKCQGKAIRKIHKELRRQRSEFISEASEFLTAFLKSFNRIIKTEGLVIFDDYGRRVEVSDIRMLDNGRILVNDGQNNFMTLFSCFDYEMVAIVIEWLTKNVNKEIRRLSRG